MRLMCLVLSARLYVFGHLKTSRLIRKLCPLPLPRSWKMSGGSRPGLHVSWGVHVHMETHSVICSPTQVNATRPITPVLDLPTIGMEGWVALGYPAMEWQGVELATSRSEVRRPNEPRLLIVWIMELSLLLRTFAPVVIFAPCLSLLIAALRRMKITIPFSHP